jgi:hypothetical protein
MDDQNIGVRGKSEARRVINAVTHSLAQQRLIVNSGKTFFLTPEEVVVHFQLDANESLSNWWDQLYSHRGHMTEDLRTTLLEKWHAISQSEAAKKGTWDKILKRFYAYATRADLDFLEQHALEHLIQFPYLSERIFNYFGKRNRGALLLDLFVNYVNENENLFETVEHQFFEALLLLDSSPELASRCLEISKEFALGNIQGQTGQSLGQSAAIICLYWFGESFDIIQNLYSEEVAISLPKEVARSWLVCVTAMDPSRYEVPMNALFGHTSDDVLRLLRFIQALISGRIASLGNYKNLKNRWPLPGKYYDAHTWLIYELASHGTNPILKNAIQNHFQSFRRVIHTNLERSIAARIAERLNIEFP